MGNEEELEFLPEGLRKKYVELIDESIKKREKPLPAPEDVKKYTKIISKKSWLKKYGEAVVGAGSAFTLGLFFVNQFYPLIENVYAFYLLYGTLAVDVAYVIYRWRRNENNSGV